MATGVICKPLPTATSLVSFFVTLWVSQDSAGPVSLSDYQSFSVVVALSNLLSITMEVGMAICLPLPGGVGLGKHKVFPGSDLPLHRPWELGLHPPRGAHPTVPLPIPLP